MVVAGLVLIGGVALILIFATKVFSPRSPTPEQLPSPSEASTADIQLARSKELYENYCTQCHGAKGAGDGPAARFLNPKPRNFGEGKFRLVSTVGHMPSDRDLVQVITRGMPGSAMFPFAHLSETDRQGLVIYIRSLMRNAVEEQLRNQAAAKGEEIDPADLTERIDEYLKPGPDVEVPADLPASSKESIARGHEVYRKRCVSCHGETGKGDGAQDQRNADGTPTRPRDFTRGIFKGSREPRALYARILLGMPGTPMPGSPDIQQAELGDVINFVLSLSDAAAQAKVEHKRTMLIAKRVSKTWNEASSEDAWRGAAPVRLVVSPLWWRDYAEPDLHVTAVHDGQTLALRLTWHDATRNDRPVRPQDFEDMAAVQLYKGTPEPFLGMGAADKPLDIWLWRSSWQQPAGQYADVDTVYPHMAVDLYPFEQPGTGPRPHATDRQPVDFLTGRAAGNALSDPQRTFTGSNLGARGFGTLTMRPRISQVVNAKGTWKNGTWTVALRRPLEVKPEAGIPLASGETISIAFAVWDGASGDRNGQKLVSIWHDLRLE
jgi:mono/diheme cytochrome c family protein